MHCIIVFFDKQQHESNAQVMAQHISSSPKQWCHFTWQNEMLAVLLLLLLHHNIKHTKGKKADRPISISLLF